MSKNDYDFDLEDILAEFGDEPEPPKPSEAAQRIERQRAAARAAAEEAQKAAQRRQRREKPQPKPEPEQKPEPEPQPEPEPPVPDERTRLVELPPEEPPKKKPAPAKPKKESLGKRLGLGVLSIVFACISALCLAWAVKNLHPDTAAAETQRADRSTDVVARLERSVYNAKAEALGVVAPSPENEEGAEGEETPAVTPVRRHYTIPETDLVAPAPNPAGYGSVSVQNAQDMLPVIEKARESGLLDGQELVFDPNVEFNTGSYYQDIQYYLDDSIFVICWKEIIDGNTCSLCEVKIADASQFRRKLVDDSFGASRQLYATALAKSANAVVAMNADFYQFRDFGIVAYQRQLYRFNDSTYTGSYKKYNCVDTCFVTGSGDFLFFHRLDTSTWDEMQRYITDNDIVFSIAFGPVLVENGELQTCDWYPAGEIDKGYSRAGIGQVGTLHYLYMGCNHSDEKSARWTVNEFAQHFYDKGVINAYCLDGGQTGELVFNGEPYNHIDFGAERLVSDIIYFASAIPESEVSP